MEKSRTDNIEIIGDPKPFKASSSPLAMTPEEHKKIGSTPLPEISSRAEAIEYLKKNLKALSKFQEAIREEPNRSRKMRLEKILREMNQKFEADLKHLAKQENTSPSNLLQGIKD